MFLHRFFGTQGNWHLSPESGKRPLWVDEKWKIAFWTISGLLAIIGVLSFADLIGINVLRPWLARLEARVAAVLFNWSVG